MTAFLKAEKLLVVLASDPNLFQSFAPLNEKLFCPKDVFNREGLLLESDAFYLTLKRFCLVYENSRLFRPL